MNLSDHEAGLVQKSWSKVSGDPDAIGKLFYSNLFDIAPQLPDTIFKGVNMAEQGKNLTTMIDTAVTKLDDLESIVPLIKASGARHVKYGAHEDHYPIVGQALLKTMRDSLAIDFTPDVEAAWSKLYLVLQTTMIEGARESTGRSESGPDSSDAVGAEPQQDGPAKEEAPAQSGVVAQQDAPVVQQEVQQDDSSPQRQGDQERSEDVPQTPPPVPPRTAAEREQFLRDMGIDMDSLRPPTSMARYANDEEDEVDDGFFRHVVLVQDSVFRDSSPKVPKRVPTSLPPEPVAETSSTEERRPCEATGLVDKYRNSWLDEFRERKKLGTTKTLPPPRMSRSGHATSSGAEVEAIEPPADREAAADPSPEAPTSTAANYDGPSTHGGNADGGTAGGN